MVSHSRKYRDTHTLTHMDEQMWPGDLQTGACTAQAHVCEEEQGRGREDGRGDPHDDEGFRPS